MGRGINFFLIFSDLFAKNVILYHLYRTTLIGIPLKHSSNIKSNLNQFQRLILNVPKDKSNIVFLSLDFDDIDPNELVTKITKKIAQFNV